MSESTAPVEGAVAEVTPTEEGAETQETKEVKAAAPQGKAEAKSAESETPTESDFLDDAEWEKIAKKKRKVKVGDVEEELTLADIYKNTGLNKSLTEKAQMTARERKELDAQREQIAGLFESMRHDPNKVFELMEALGHNPDDLAVKRAYERMKYEKMSPEEKEALKLKQKVAEYERKEAERKAQEEAQQFEAQQQQLFDEAKADIDEVVSLLGENDYLSIDRIAQMSQALYYKHGKKPSAQQVAEAVRRNADQERNQWMGKLTVDQVESMLPDSIKKQLRDRWLAANMPRLPHGSSQQGSNPKASEARTKAVGIDDWFNSLGSK